MDLQNILKKNKHKVLKLASFKMPAPPSIAVEDRPYNDIDLKVNLKKHEKLVANGKKIGSKQLVINKETNRKQIGNKQVSNRYQTGSKQVAEDFETGSRTGSRTGSKQVAEQVAKQVAEQVARSSSSSSYINTTTKTHVHTAREEELPAPWRAVDYSGLTNIEFNVDHLLQLCQRGTLEPEVVQDSLYHFAFDLQHNKKRDAIKGDPLNYLMGVLAKRPYTAPANYINPNVEAFRRYAEEKARQDEQLQVLEAKVQDFEFQSWYDYLPQEDLDALCATMGEQSALPDALQKTIRMRHLRKHFNDFVWPELRRRLRSIQTF